MLIDTHSHLHDPSFDVDREAVIDRAVQAGVQMMVTVGTDLDTSFAAIALAEQYSFIHATVGVHPHEAKTVTSDGLEKLRELGKHPCVVAYGEIGLDYYYDHSSRDIQRARFKDQLGIARDLDLPIVIHTRDAQEDTLAILKDEWKDRPGVFHCFTGDTAYAIQVLELGFMISFSGIVTFSKALELREAANVVPLDRLLIETDCPYLAPVPHRGKRNEPAYLHAIVKTIAAGKPSVSIEEVAVASYDNAKKLFGISG